MQSSRGQSSDLVKQLTELLNEGSSKLCNKKREKAILVMGASGAGKSTLCSLFGKFPLVAKKQKGSIIIENSINQKDNIIGKQPPKIAEIWCQSETKIPNEIEIEIKNINNQEYFSIFDCPGFFETGGIVQEIANQYYNHQIMLQTDQIKFILVTTQNSILDSKGKNFVDSLNHFANIFENVNELKNSVAICITKTESHMVKQDIIELIEDLLKSNNLFTQEAKKLIVNSKNNVFLFQKPTKEGPVIEQELFQEIYKSINYLDLKIQHINQIPSKQKTIFRMSFSQESLQLLQPMVTQSENEFTSVINNLQSFYVKYFEKLQYKQHEIKEINKRIHGYRVLSKDIILGNVKDSHQREYLQIYQLYDMLFLHQQFQLLISIMGDQEMNYQEQINQNICKTIG